MTKPVERGFYPLDALVEISETEESLPYDINAIRVVLDEDHSFALTIRNNMLHIRADFDSLNYLVILPQLSNEVELGVGHNRDQTVPIQNDKSKKKSKK